MADQRQELINRGLLILGEGVVIEDFVVLCQQEETSEDPCYPTVIGANTRIRSGCIIRRSTYWVQLPDWPRGDFAVPRHPRRPRGVISPRDRGA